MVDSGLVAMAFQVVLWGAFAGLIIGGVNTAIAAGTALVMFMFIGLVGKPSSRYGVYE